MHASRKALALGVLLALIGLNILVWVLLALKPAGTLTVSFLDVGQGDAILIQSPTGTEVLIDGGRDRSILRALTKQMGPLDRTIDLVVATHPDADHIGGLSAVFDRYQIDTFMEPGVASDTTPSESLASRLQQEKDVETIVARRGDRIELGGGAYADILFPDRTVTTLETNTASVIMRVVYGETSFLLTGDAPTSVEEWLVVLDGSTLASDVLKAGHHGSRTSTSDTFLSTVDPHTVVVSAGKDNSYGHPHTEIVERIRASGAALASTLGEGPVTFVSNGTTIEVR